MYVPDGGRDFAAHQRGMKNPLSAVKVGLALRKAGFEQVRVAGKRGYRVVMYTIEEVNRNRRAMGRFTEAPAEE